MQAKDTKRKTHRVNRRRDFYEKIYALRQETVARPVIIAVADSAVASDLTDAARTAAVVIL